MTQEEYWKQMIAIRYAELAVQEGILNTLQGMAVKQNVAGTGHHWDRAKKMYENALLVTAPPKSPSQP